MTQGIERRFAPTELRAARKDGATMPTIEGHAAVFDSLSVELWGFFEEIAPGAFADSIAAGDDVRALFNHDPNYVLGRTRNGTLRLAEDEIGLRVEFEPPDTAQARDVVTLIERGDVSQMSFAFAVLEEKWRIDDMERYVRRIVRAKLYDVSPVTYPAYPATDVGVRAAGVFGEIPVIPADLVQGRQAAADGDQVQARLEVLRLRLEIAERALPEDGGAQAKEG